MWYKKEFITPENVLIKYDIFEQERSNNKALIYIHGLGGTLPELVKPCFEYLNEHGIDVFIPHQRYTPLSNQKTGHINSFDEIIYDLKKLIDFIQTERKHKKIYLLGHSLGATLAFELAKSMTEKPVKLIIVNPAFRVKGKFNLWQTINFIYKTIFRRHSATVKQRSNPKNKVTTIAQKESQARRSSELITQSYSPHFLLAAKKITKQCLSLAKENKMPALFIISKQDEVVWPDGSEEVFDNYGSEQKELVQIDAEHGTFVFNMLKEKIADFILS